jgi:hypothetical protein
MLVRNIRTIAGSSLTTSYQNVGVVTTISGYKMCIVNATTTDVQVSDGSASDAFYVPAGSSISVGEGLSGSGREMDTKASFMKGIQLQAKLPSGSAGTGTLVITVIGY